MKKKLLISVIFTTLIFAQEGGIDDDKKIMKEGIKYIKIVGKALKGEVAKRLKKDPTGVEAAKFCSLKANEVAKKAMENFPKNIKVRRTAIKYRNPNNKPDDIDLKVMQEYQKSLNSNNVSLKPKVVKVDSNTTRVYKPLLVENACMKCHGDIKKTNQEVSKIIKEHYPNDKAFGFKLGDLRGVIVAEIKKEK